MSLPVYTRLEDGQKSHRSYLSTLILLSITVAFVLFCAIGFLTTTRPGKYLLQPPYYQPQPEYVWLNQSKLMQQLKFVLNCHSTEASFRIEQRGKYWVLENILTPSEMQIGIRQPRRPVQCYETITYTTHGDYRFLDNIVPLLERWDGPLSLALYAPGHEIERAIDGLRWLMFCHRQSYLVEEWLSVHLYFDSDRMPPMPIQYYRDRVYQPIDDCPRPYFEDPVDPTQPSLRQAGYNDSSDHIYPVNVGRNIAREAATTHFVLASDIELYPNPDFIEMFLQMIAQSAYWHTLAEPSVYVLPIFEVPETATVPEKKFELLQMLNEGEAIKFHEKICERCHTVPGYESWLKVIKQDDTMGIVASASRTGPFALWEPIFVGTKREPLYDERLSWEGKFDKMSQGYIMCVQDYKFYVLDNGFLVHKPGIKSVSEAARPELEQKQRKFVEEVIFEELKILYGESDQCEL
ncbi:beta-1,4-glucuronyltransferase 1-like [Sabethes cyaneus]|uniref:beta-1,4-glucuronyltransferase 1-like n=1 Tax=Sabethes cyaneus TaxID=53552 RepID=UPI00237EAB25|nr:beta-1,4-glucuronyltransferase 1-like [Sabethes cyaneus]